MLALILIIVSGCRQSNVKNQLELYDLSGQYVSLEKYDNSYLLVNFWATWCKPCIEEMPTLEKLNSEMSGNLQVILVSEESQEKIEGFKDRYGITLPMYRMPDAINEFQLQFLPTTMLISPGGKVLFVEEGERVWDAPDMLQKISDFMAN
jgi:thiol-disulfide isomerase/thioredoxin